jgi:hypothetical protein
MPAARPALTWWRWAVPVAALLAITATFLAVDKRELFSPAGQEARVTNDSYSAAKPATKAEAPATPALSPQPKVTRSKSQEETGKKSLDVKEAKARALADKSSESFTMDTASRKPATPPPPAAPVSQVVGGTLGSITSSNAANLQMNNSMGGPSQRVNTQGVGANSIQGDVVTQKQASPPPAAASEVVEVRSQSAGINTLSAGPARAFIAPSAQDAQRPRRNAISRMAAELWRITPDGHLERLMQNQWHRTLNQVQKAFHVVATVENHVWAGGKGPELFHSSDGGDNWNTIQVKAADGTLNGTMRSIHADDAMHVAIITDNGETWITADGGQTWSKQQ